MSCSLYHMSQGVGAIFGNASSTSFQVAVRDSSLRRLDYVEAPLGDEHVLGQVVEVERQGSIGYEEALAGHRGEGERLVAKVHVVGFRDSGGNVNVPATPFAAGTPVVRASDELVADVLGLGDNAASGALLGHLRGTTTPVALSLNNLAQKHVSVLAKTGAGKSYTVAVLLEEFLKARVPLVILDPHGEYGSLRSANTESRELKAMLPFGLRPKAFQKQVAEFAVDTTLNPDASPLVLDGMNMEAREIGDLVPGGLTGGQMGVLYQAVKEVKETLPAYTLQDVADAVGRNQSSAKWNVLNALEALQSTGVFDIRSTPVKDLVKPGQCSIINLKGVPPDIQEIVVTRLAGALWHARKRSDVPAHILVVEEAHNFCPERGVGKATSGAVLRTVASEGRKFGLGLMIVSQRPAKVDKNVLSQCHTQVILKLTNPNDLKAVVAGVEGITNDAMEEVQRLPVGFALVAGGGLTQPIYVRVRPRQSRHGGRSVDVIHANVDAPPETDGQDTHRDCAGTDRGGNGTEDAIEPIPPEEDVASRTVGPPLPSVAKTAADAAIAVDVPMGAAPGDPVHSSSDGGERTPPEVEPQPPSWSKPHGHWSREDQHSVLRVLQRLGMVGGDSLDAVMPTVTRIAAPQSTSGDALMEYYLDIANVACHAERPACARCPLHERCDFHLASQQQRRKSRSLIRRLWRP